MESEQNFGEYEIDFFDVKMRPELDRMGLEANKGDLKIAWERKPNGWIEVWDEPA